MSTPAPPAHADPRLAPVMEAQPAGITDNSEGMAYLERLPRRLDELFSRRDRDQRGGDRERGRHSRDRWRWSGNRAGRQAADFNRAQCR